MIKSTLTLILVLSPLITQAESQVDPDRADVPTVMSAFNEGGKQYQALGKFDEKKVCAKFSDWYRLYCLDGFYFVSHLEKLKGLSPKQMDILRKHLEATLPETSELRRSFARSLGSSFSQLDLDPRDYWEALKGLNDDEKLFFIDGWGSANYFKFGYEVSRQRCDMPPADQVKAACQWGMGRGFFYSSIPAGNPPGFDPNFVMGYDFARAMTKSTSLTPDQALKVKTPGAKTAELYKVTAFKKPKAAKIPAKIGECLSKRHFTECYQLL